jgi:hypothetical protein|tara:strand:+ start:8826 stop:9101 length:276 start_codon:yes stop_codon:yes gene_type:complete
MTKSKVEFNVGDKVSWIKPMTCVPHPEGRTDRDGKVLPVFRDKLEKGRVIGTNASGLSIRPDWAEQYKNAICGERYYDATVLFNDETLKLL